MKNLLNDLPTSVAEELVEVLASSSNVRVERIVSNGHASPPNFWYDQNQHEWVAVLSGQAKLLFQGDPSPIEMRTGDHLLIPAHQKHRVEWTSADEPTIWLAVFFSA